MYDNYKISNFPKIINLFQIKFMIAGILIVRNMIILMKKKLSILNFVMKTVKGFVKKNFKKKIIHICVWMVLNEFV